ncbi:MAG: M3 family metallopeptidase [Mucinivorans sp.]
MMKKILMTTLLASAALAAMASNPFFEPWTTPHGVPPFSQIKNEHYMPAIKQGIDLQKAEIAAIVANPAAPTFENTILAYDNSGADLEKVGFVFFNITSTDMTEELEALEGEISTLLTVHGSDISLNTKLFERIKAVWNNRASLDKMQQRLTDKIYKSFERNGANLSQEQKTQLRAIDQKLSDLSLDFGNNLRRDNSKFVLNVTKKSELAGLPVSSIDAAAAEAKSRGMKGWVFTLDKPSMIPFLQYADMRYLREKLYKGYLERCNNGDQNDNKEVIRQMTTLRAERAKLMGFDSHAAFILDRNMAKNPDAVYALLQELWTPALRLAYDEMQQMKALGGAPSDFQSWDWWYWAERLRKAKYDLNEDELRPYFSLDNVRQGIFTLTGKLYGVTYKLMPDAEKYNPECQVYQVNDRDGAVLGVLYLDFHPRAGKRVGAWCTSFRDQGYKDGKKIYPIVSIVCNFTPSTVEGQPALLNLDETETFFHEFGHGLHSLFADVPYKGLGGVERDFVELPSQIMENWAFEPEVLALYAKHYKTGEVIPATLVEKIKNSALFNQGFMTVEYLGASLLDMDFHTITAPIEESVAEFENNSLSKFGLMSQIAPRYRSTYFQHIFSGGYSSGYYSYIWAEVLDSDAFEAFREAGNLFDQATAERFRREILSRGGMADGGELYQNFRGKAPSKTALMHRRGLVCSETK